MTEQLRALIGNTGFVGGNLGAQQHFTHHFNSKNFTDMAGQEFDELVCAGVQAVKWWANQNPEEDWHGIAPLLEVLERVRARRVILISTVDVYKAPDGVDEATPIETDGLHPYGLHRWRVEEFVRDRFADHRILRLPGLYGRGLKKNLIYDVMHGGELGGFDERSAFQFYNLARLGADIDVAASGSAGTYNLAVAPVSVAQVVEAITGAPYSNRTEAGPLRYDMQSCALSLWGLDGRYLEDEQTVLAGIVDFAAGQA